MNGNQTLSSNPSWGDSTADATMLVVIVNGDLTINSGIIVTPLSRKKGFTLFVTGTLINNGTISMTARGANAVGQDVYLWANENDTYEYVPAVGANGGTGRSGATNADNYPELSGSPGVDRQLGGGGGGASHGTNNRRGGHGSSATSYSGGSAGGGCYNTSSAGSNNDIYQDAQPNGGSGGRGTAKGGSGTTRSSGGAGNPSGNNAYSNSSTTYSGNESNNPNSNGTGGLLILFARFLFNYGEIVSQGSNSITSTNTTRLASGGGSGGGSINIFYSFKLQEGICNANGGEGIGTGSYGTANARGGYGGNGSITLFTIYFDRFLVEDNGVLKYWDPRGGGLEDRTIIFQPFINYSLRKSVNN